MDTPQPPEEWNIKTSFSPGTLLAGRYEIRQKLGAGGMGVVLRALDRKLNGEEVALKILRPQFEDADPLALPRLINEVRLARALTHPNIVRIHDIGETEDGAAYVSMEFIAGQCLSDVISDSKKGIRGLPFEEAYRYFVEIARGVAYAHSKGIIHRDLKPANILISKSKEIKIADFGIARTIENEMALTRTGEAVGTPAYMAPEQFRGEELDARCDVYALGILAHQMLTGELPFSSKSFFNLALQHMNDELPPLSACNVSVPEWFEAIIFKAASKDKRERYSSAAALVEALEGRSSSVKLRRINKQPVKWYAAAGSILLVAGMGYAALALRSPQTATPALPNRAEATAPNAPAIVVQKAEPAAPAEREAAEGELKEFSGEQGGKAGLPGRESPGALLQRQPIIALKEEAEKLRAKGEVPLPRKVLRNLREEFERENPEAAANLPQGPFARNAERQLAPRPLLNGKPANYAGSILLPGSGAQKTLTLNLQKDGEAVLGRARIVDLGQFNVSGKIGPDGVNMRLSGTGISFVLTGSNRGGQLNGQFSTAGQDGPSGKWNATLRDD